MGMQSKLNILTLNYEYPPVGGGGGYICKNVMDELAANGHRITVITSQFDGIPVREDNGNVRIFRVPVLMRTKQDVGSLPSLLSYVPSAILKAQALIDRQKFDIISTHFAVPTGPAGYYLSLKFGIPNVLTLYGGDIYDPTKKLSPHRMYPLRVTVRKMLCGADHIISDSSDIEGHARRIYGFGGDITVIPPGVTPYRGKKPTRKELGLPEEGVLLVTLGRLVVRKNNLELIRIFDSVVQRHNCHLLIMGDGPEMGAIAAEVDQLGLQPHVTLAGRVGEEKFQYMLAADIYVSTAVHEGFGLVFLEALESGLPVISYDNGGQVDFLKDGLTGYLVKLGDAKSFQNRLEDLIVSAERRAAMSAHNTAYIQNFYIEKCAGQYLHAIDRVLQATG